VTEISPAELTETLSRQRTAFIEDGPPGLKTRLDRLDRAIGLIVDNRSTIVAALEEDFGQRSRLFSELSDIAGVIQPLKYAKEHLEQWMHAEPRAVNEPLDQFGARARIEYQPLGVVGIVAPWNAPMRLIFHPLSSVLAAGNRAMIKPSELTPACSGLLADVVPQYFDVAEVAIFPGGPDVAEAFVSLPFDHLIYTGGTEIGRKVMRAAAENLVPVTLELGGKCPVLVGASAPVKLTADRIMTGKALNAGQACIAPDYVFVPEERLDDYVEALTTSAREQYPTITGNPDYTAIINSRHYSRIIELIDDARDKGAEIMPLGGQDEALPDAATKTIPPTIILNVTEEMKVSREEIFGPLLPIRTYSSIDDAIAYVNAHPRPLALYYFGSDGQEEHRVLSRTTSGNVTVNDVIMHTTQDDLPFGGVGPSGMGSYRGIHGFRTFSHAKGVFTQAEQDIAAMAGLRPPFDERLAQAMNYQIQR
jgi:coniferyl-aldehyde dehydrogenase